MFDFLYSSQAIFSFVGFCVSPLRLVFPDELYFTLSQLLFPAVSLCRCFNIVSSRPLLLFLSTTPQSSSFSAFASPASLLQPSSILFCYPQAHLRVSLHFCIMGKTELCSLYKGFLDCICLCLSVSISIFCACIRCVLASVSFCIALTSDLKSPALCGEV